MALARQLGELVDGLSELVQKHVQLARVELTEDAKYVGIRVGIIAALSPLILVGYGFLCAAVAFGLQSIMSPALAFMTVGLLNVVPGLVGIALAARQLSSKRVLHETMAQLETTTALVVTKERP